MSQCPSCAAPQIAGAAFCHACGASLPQPAEAMVPVTMAAAPAGAASGDPFAGAAPGPAAYYPPPAAAPSVTVVPPAGATGSATASLAGLAGRVPWSDLVLPAKQAVAVLGAAVLAMTVLVAIAAGLLLPSGHHGGPGDWLFTGVWLVGLGLGGSLRLVGHAGGDMLGASMSGSAAVSLRFLPLLITIAVVGTIVVLSRRDERLRPSATTGALLQHAGAHAVASGAFLAIAGALTRTSSAYGVGLPDLPAKVDLSLGLNVWPTAFAAAVIVFITSAVARVTTTSGNPKVDTLRQRLAPFGPAVRLLTIQSALLCAGAVAALVVGYVVAFVKDPHQLSKLPGLVAATVVLAANVVPVVVLMLCGVPLSATATQHASAELLHLVGGSSSPDIQAGHFGVLDGWHWEMLLLLVPLVATVVAAVVYTLRRPAQEWQARIQGSLVGRAAVVGAAAFGLMALLQQTSVSASIAASASGSFLLGIPSDAGGNGTASWTGGPQLIAAVAAGAVWGALAVVVLRLAPTFALAAPRLAQRIARRTDESWLPILGGEQPAPQGAVAAPWVKRAGMTVAAVALLAGAGTVAVKTISSTVYSPNKVAFAYLDAIGRGDAKAALALRSTASGTQPLLRDEVLRAAGVVRPSKIRAVSGTVTGQDAHVEMAFSLGGSEQKMQLDLTSASKRMGLFPQWRITSGLGQVAVGATAVRGLTVGGASVSAGATLAAFPATYPVRADDQNGMFNVNTSSVQVTDGSSDLSVAYGLSSKGRQAVTDAVNGYIDDCVKATAVSPDGCPFSAYNLSYGFGTVSNVRYHLTSRPDLQISLSSNGDVTVDSTNEGTVSYEGDVDDGFSVAHQTDNSYFTVSGTAILTGSGATFNANSN